MLFHIASIAAGLLTISTLAQASNVVELNPSNFDSVVGKGKPALVEFFAPWCGHCKNLAPIYEELADAYAHTDDVIIAKVDADAEKALGQKYGVKGFPTLKWFDKNGEPEPYEGGRQLDDLASFITKKSGVKSKIKPPPPPVVTQLNYATLEETINDPTKDVLVAFTASWCGHCKAMKPTYEKVAQVFKPEKNVIVANYESDAEPNRDLAQKHEIKSFPTIKFYPKGSDKTPILYEGGRAEKDFVTYLNEKCGTFRAPGGGLNDEAGRIEKLDELAQNFFNAVPTSRKSIYDTALSVAESSNEYGKHYIRAMEKTLNGTADYIEKETARLATILQKRTLSDEKLDQIKVKANILAAFVAKKAEGAAESAEEKLKVLLEDIDEAKDEARRVKEEL